MTKEQTLGNLSPLHQPPDEPHFDDELTILKARPVVPLKQFDERLQRKRKWFLFGMFVLAMFLGAASGLISAYFKLREVSEEPVIQLGVATLRAPEEPPPSTVSEEPDTNNGFGNLLPGLPSLEEKQLKLFTPKRPVIRPRRVSINTKHSVPLPSLSDEEELQRIREALLSDDSKRRRVRPTERREQRRF
ncbi:MAG TPA: hypothetical protein VMZ30_12325 [Pyrinomonadaceae bacterium]|nr:hypothetical protein [Pyrinomonadaceae bacterium]